MRGASSMLALGADVGIDPQLDEILPKMKTSVTRKKRNVGLMVEIDTALVLAKITEEMEKRSPKKENALIPSKLIRRTVAFNNRPACRKRLFLRFG